jgi:hypothetical protein
MPAVTRFLAFDFRCFAVECPTELFKRLDGLRIANRAGQSKGARSFIA